MTQKDKELLLKDLCARVPYGVKVEYNNEKFGIEYVSPMYEEVKLDTHETWTIDVSEVKPYLLPISSMTKEQRKESESLMEVVNIPVWGDILTPSTEYYEWLNKHHFDYRGLIEKGIALDVTGLGVY